MKFVGLSLDEQHEMVLNSLPKNIRFVFNCQIKLPNFRNQIRLETIPSVSKVVLMENVFEQTKIPATPQGHLDDGVLLLKRRSAALSSEASWASGSLQLKNLLLCHQLNEDDHKLKRKIVKFLKNSFTDQVLWDLFLAAWKNLEEGHVNLYNDNCTLDEVKKMLVDAEYFCNILYNIYMENSLSRDDFINGVSPSIMHKLLIPIDEKWNTIETWKKLGKIELEGTRPNIKLIFK
ncbi:unnamed protein product [Meloidogyne enterolobii]|uniref:Uncharacterized protein n=1 Tax=Meloidogyne enterolobii TaxID=390850 RepID=A0ACB0ZI27_MELEN